MIINMYFLNVISNLVVVIYRTIEALRHSAMSIWQNTSIALLTVQQAVTLSGFSNGLGLHSARPVLRLAFGRKQAGQICADM